MRYALASALFIVAGGASAQGSPPDGSAVPVRDVDAVCSTLADGSAGNGRASRNVALSLCVQEEQQGYDTSKLLWDHVSLSLRRECLTHAASFGPPNYYRALGSCLEAKYAVEGNARQMQQMRSAPQGFRP